MTIITLENGDTNLYVNGIVYEMNTKIPLLFDFLLFALWVKGIKLLIKLYFIIATKIFLTDRKYSIGSTIIFFTQKKKRKHFP